MIMTKFYIDFYALKNRNTQQANIIKTELKPISQSKGEKFLAIMSSFDDDFVNAVAERDNEPVQEREPL